MYDAFANDPQRAMRKYIFFRRKIMKKAKRFAAFIAAAAITVTGVSVLAACGGDNGEGGGGGNSDVAGTYTISYSTTEISGNVRHTGYLSAMQATETNTLVLKADNTYEYTKYVTSNRDDLGTASRAIATQAETADENLLFAWASAGDGNCTLDFNKDGTYKFVFTSYGMTETGTWTWNNWSLKLKQSNNTEITATMDNDSHALNLHYVAESSAMLTHDFTCSADVWGAAFGGQGTYTPVESGGSEQAISVTAYFSGSGQKSTEYGGQTVTYDVTVELIALSSGDVYYVEATETNSTVAIGTSTQDGKITVNGKDVTMDGSKMVYDGVTLSYGTLPEKYNGADWAALVAAAKKPVASGPIVISYKFTGTYTVSGTTVTLNAATACTWSEDWGSLGGQGFTNCSGTANDKVYPKGETGDWYLPLDHFGGKYYFAPTITSGTASASVTNNNAVKVTVNKNGTFEYVEESAFD